MFALVASPLRQNICLTNIKFPGGFVVRENGMAEVSYKSCGSVFIRLKWLLERYAVVLKFS